MEVGCGDLACMCRTSQCFAQLSVTDGLKAACNTLAAPAGPQVVDCLQLEERAAAAGLWPGDEFVLLATASLGQLHELAVDVIFAKGGLLCWTWQYTCPVCHAYMYTLHMDFIPPCLPRARASCDTSSGL